MKSYINDIEHIFLSLLPRRMFRTVFASQLGCSTCLGFNIPGCCLCLSLLFESNSSTVSITSILCFVEN